jgi:uncharacterized protein YyaL (SSP411 family)
MMVTALSRASRVFKDQDWLDLAIGAYRFVVESMSRAGRLGHSWRDGKLLFPGLASDHAAMIRAALALAEATGERAFVADAANWAETMQTYHADPQTGGYFLTASDATTLVVRPRSTLDEATPNPNGVMAEALLRLAVATGDQRWRDRADEVLIGLSPQINANLFGHASLLNALDLRLSGAQIVVTGEGPDADALREAAGDLPFPSRIVLNVAAPGDLPAGHPAHAKAASGQKGGPAAAFICVGEACSMPVFEPPALRQAFAAARSAR